MHIRNGNHKEAMECIKSVAFMGYMLVKLEKNLLEAAYSVKIRTSATRFIHQYMSYPDFQCNEMMILLNDIALYFNSERHFRGSVDQEIINAVYFDKKKFLSRKYFFKKGLLLFYFFFVAFTEPDPEDHGLSITNDFSTLPKALKIVRSQIGAYCPKSLANQSPLNTHSNGQFGYTLPLKHRCLMMTYYNLVKISVAITCFKQSHGKLPDSLEDLMPNYLKEIPIDPFGGGKLGYSKEDRIIYSIGYDYTDSGGCRESAENNQNGLDTEPTVLIDY